MEPPSLYIGIDLGTTLTGVAYAAPGDRVIRTVQRWPGTYINEPKVPTRLFYRNDTLLGWGFKEPEDFLASRADQQPICIVEGFKLGIDPSLTSESTTTNIEVAKQIEVYKWYKDFLDCLYSHIQEEVGVQTGFTVLQEEAWSRSPIEFVFSVPNVYGPHIISKYTELIKETRFGHDQHHISIVNMTESQAAVVWVSQRLKVFRNNNLVLVCDAGGGTTDCGLLRIVVEDDERLQMEEVSPAFGTPIGSTSIDRAILKLAKTRMEDQWGTDCALDDTAIRDIKNYKESFNIFQDEPLMLSVKRAQDYEMLSITSQEVSRMFGTAVAGIYECINDEMVSLSETGLLQDGNIYVVLCGGLGSSPYVTRRLTDLLANGNGDLASAIPYAQVIEIEQPQLVVALGLVAERMWAAAVATGLDLTLKESFETAEHGFVTATPDDLSLLLYDPEKEDMEGGRPRRYGEDIQWKSNYHDGVLRCSAQDGAASIEAHPPPTFQRKSQREEAPNTISRPINIREKAGAAGVVNWNRKGRATRSEVEAESPRRSSTGPDAGRSTRWHTTVKTSKKTLFTTITPLPANVPRELVVAMLHDHNEMIQLNSLVIEHHPIKAPRDAPVDEYFDCVWHEITDQISYVPGIKSKISYKACFHDYPSGLQIHVYAPRGVHLREKWSVGGNLPDEPPEPRELGVKKPTSGLYLREDGNLQHNRMTHSSILKNLDVAHKILVERIIKKAEQIDEFANNCRSVLLPGCRSPGVNSSHMSRPEFMRSAQGSSGPRRSTALPFSQHSPPQRYVDVPQTVYQAYRNDSDSYRPSPPPKIQSYVPQSRQPFYHSFEDIPPPPFCLEDVSHPLNLPGNIPTAKATKQFVAELPGSTYDADQNLPQFSPQPNNRQSVIAELSGLDFFDPQLPSLQSADRSSDENDEDRGGYRYNLMDFDRLQQQSTKQERRNNVSELESPLLPQEECMPLNDLNSRLPTTSQSTEMTAAVEPPFTRIALYNTPKLQMAPNIEAVSNRHQRSPSVSTISSIHFFPEKTSPTKRWSPSIIKATPALAVGAKMSTAISSITANKLPPTSIFRKRRCRVSYGVLKLELYDESKHLRQDVWKFPLNGKLYVENLIEWVIKQGDEIDDSWTRKFLCQKMLSHADNDAGKYIFQTHLVTSNKKIHQLPKSMTQGGAQALCNIEADLSKFPLSEFEKHVHKISFMKKRIFYLVKYHVAASSTPADIIFEVLFRGKQAEHRVERRVLWHDMSEKIPLTLTPDVASLQIVQKASKAM